MLTPLLVLINFLVSQPQLNENAIGVVYYNSAIDDSTVLLTIVFPINYVENQPENFFKGGIEEFYTFPFSGELAVFDEKGKLISIHGKQLFKVEFWCDNDGGTQYRPTLKLLLNKIDIEREFNIHKELQNIIGFVIANPNYNSFSKIVPHQFQNEDIRLRADFNRDENIDALITVYYDEAENCGGKPENNLGINLRTYNKMYFMRCCGP